MIFKMYSVRDELRGYHAPIPFENEELAKRWFDDRMNQDNIMHDHPEDFNLYYMGTFDNESGTYVMMPADIKRVVKGVDCIGSHKMPIQETL